MAMLNNQMVIGLLFFTDLFSFPIFLGVAIRIEVYCWYADMRLIVDFWFRAGMQLQIRFAQEAILYLHHISSDVHLFYFVMG